MSSNSGVSKSRIPAQSRLRCARSRLVLWYVISNAKAVLKNNQARSAVVELRVFTSAAHPWAQHRRYLEQRLCFAWLALLQMRLASACGDARVQTIVAAEPD